MKRFIITLLVCCSTALMLSAAVPTWSVTPSNYSNSMVMVGVINVNQVESVDSNDMVAAFINGEVRGVANLQYEAAADRYIAYLLVYSNESSGVVTFKIYDADADVEIDAQNTTSFVINGSEGNIGAPVIWSDVLLSDEAVITSFSFPESIGEEVIETGSIEITVPYATDVTTMVAEFSASNFASIWVTNVAQISGVTIQDFSAPVTYQVIAENGVDFTDYSVEVLLTNNPTPTDISVTFGSTSENNVIDAIIATLAAIDDEADSHSFSLVSGSGDTDNSLFEISNNQIIAKTVFDFETQSIYTIRIQVEDSYSQTFEKVVEVTITDENEAPTLSGGTFTIPENSVDGFYLGTLQATDPEESTLSYSILSGNESGGFSLELSTGVLIVADQSQLDFETSPSFTLSVEVSDGELSDIASIFINLTDVEEQVNQAPTISDQSFTVNEHSIAGFVIGTLSGSDPDGDVLVYSLVGTSSVFSLNTSTGELSVLDPSALDFETSPQFVLQASVSDGSLTTSATITVNLNDVDESVNQAPQISNQVFSLPENSTEGFEVGTVSAGDPDGDEITYSMTGGDGAFSIAASTGILTVADSAIVDFELNSQFILTATVSDGTLSSSATIVINVTDVNEAVNSAPVLTDLTFTIPENSIEGFYLGTLQAADPDGNSLSYSILTGNESDGFSLDSSSGVLLVADQSQLDFETSPSFTLSIEVSDGELSDIASIIINLTDVEEIVNQAPTIVDQNFSVDENAAVGSIIGRISGDDPDGDMVIFSLTNVSDVFTINAASGEIIALNTEALDFESTASFSLEVNVTDGSLTSSATITITINDVDENVLGLKESIHLDIYPNPAVDKINVRSSEKVKIIECYDLNGIKLISSLTTEISVSHLKAGVYILYVHQLSGIKVSRFIKR